MKKILFTALLLSGMIVSAQTETKKALVINESTKVIDLDATSNTAPTYTVTGYTATLKGTSYPVYKSSKGKMFIFMVSKKSGKQYRKYID